MKLISRLCDEDKTSSNNCITQKVGCVSLFCSRVDEDQKEK